VPKPAGSGHLYRFCAPGFAADSAVTSGQAVQRPVLRAPARFRAISHAAFSAGINSIRLSTLAEAGVLAETRSLHPRADSDLI